MTMVEIKHSIPEGYEAVEVRIAKVGDIVIRFGKVAHNANDACRSPELILRKKRWRGDKGQIFFYVAEDLEAKSDMEYNLLMDDKLHNAGNYFETIAEAEEVASKIKALLAQ